MAERCGACGCYVGCACGPELPATAERVLAALALGDHIMELMGSPAASLGQVEMWQDDTRKIYERLWRASRPKRVADGVEAWDRILDPDL